MVADKVLSKLESKDLAVYVVWTPVLGNDDLESAKSAVEAIEDSRATHYWDGDGALGHLFAKAVELPNGRSFAWDIYFAFRPDAVWKDTVPSPSDWMHQLARDERQLDGNKLRESVKALLPAKK